MISFLCSELLLIDIKISVVDLRMYRSSPSIVFIIYRCVYVPLSTLIARQMHDHTVAAFCEGIKEKLHLNALTRIYSNRKTQN